MLTYKLLERWISWFLASLKVAANCEILVVWIARHIGPFGAAEHLTNWTSISLCRLICLTLCVDRLQRVQLSAHFIYTHNINNYFTFHCVTYHMLSSHISVASIALYEQLRPVTHTWQPFHCPHSSFVDYARQLLMAVTHHYSNQSI